MSHVTVTPLSSQKVKGQGHQAALLTAVLARQAAARWAWERVGRGKLLLRCRLLGGSKHFGAHGGAYRGGRPPTVCFVSLYVFTLKVLIT